MSYLVTQVNGKIRQDLISNLIILIWTWRWIEFDPEWKFHLKATDLGQSEFPMAEGMGWKRSQSTWSIE